MYSLLLVFSQANPQTRIEPMSSNGQYFVGKSAPCTWSLFLRWVSGGTIIFCQVRNYHLRVAFDA